MIRQADRINPLHTEAMIPWMLPKDMNKGYDNLLAV